MQILLSFLFLAVVSNIAAQNTNTASGVREDPARSTLRARVFYEDTGRVVKRTSVMLITRGGGGGSREGSGTTDGRGNLEIKNLKAGKYYAIVNAPGVVSPLAYIDFRREKGEGGLDDQLLAFPPIVINGFTDTEAQIPVRRGGAVSGRVTYSDGDPAVGIKIEVLRKTEDDHVATVANLSVFATFLTGGIGSLQTDDRGYFRVAGLPGGEYIVKATENVTHSTSDRARYGDPFESLFMGSGSMVSMFFDNVFEKSKAQPLNVALGQETPEISIVLPDRELKNVSGKVIAAKDKLPVRGAKLTILRDGDDSNLPEPVAERFRQQSSSDEKGEWLFTELPKGKYNVIVEVSNSEFDEKDKAYGSSGKDSALNALNEATSAVNTVASNGSTVRIPKIVPKFTKKIHEINLADGDEPIIIEMGFGSTISGSVTTEDGPDMPANVVITASTEDEQLKSTAQIYNYQAEEGGQARKVNHEFKIESVTTGKILIGVFLTQHDYYVKSITHGTTDLLKDGIELKSGQDLKDVKIILARDMGTLKASVVDGSKQPLAGEQLHLIPTDPLKQRNPTYYRTLTSDESGDIDAKLAPIEWAIIVRPRAKRRDEFLKALGEAVKNAQTFKIEAGKTQKIVVTRDPRTR